MNYIPNNVESEIIDGKKHIYLTKSTDALTNEEYFELSLKYYAHYVSIDGKIVKNP